MRFIIRLWENKLAFVAWTIEIFVAWLGLNLAFTSMGTKFSFNDLDNILIGSSAAFIIIAILELCKIPLVETIYKTKNFFLKILFIVLLIFSSIITMETIFFSQSNNYNKMIAKIVPIYDEIKSNNEQINRLKTQITNKTENNKTTQEAQSIDIDNRSKLQKELVSIENRYEKAAQSIRDNIDSLEKSKNIQENIIKDIDDNKIPLVPLNEETQNKRNNAVDETKNIDRNIRQYRNSLNTLTAKYEEEKNSKQTQINKESEKHTKRIQQQSEKIDSNIDKKDELEEKILALENEIKKSKHEIRNIGSENQMYMLARTVYSVKNYFKSDENKKYIEQKELDLVAFVWFTSISILAGILGSLIYLAHLVSKYPPKSKFDLFTVLVLLYSFMIKPFWNNVILPIFISIGKIWVQIGNISIGTLQFFSLNRNFSDKPASTMRGWLRKRSQRFFSESHKFFKEPRPTKIVYKDKLIIKEVKVPVEKIVEKEVIRKELVHVPMYTNDISKLKSPWQHWFAKADDKMEKSQQKTVKKDKK